MAHRQLPHVRRCQVVVAEAVIREAVGGKVRACETAGSEAAVRKRSSADIVVAAKAVAESRSAVGHGKNRGTEQRGRTEGEDRGAIEHQSSSAYDHRASDQYDLVGVYQPLVH